MCFQFYSASCNIYCLVCLQEFELVRVWDSLVFEDDCEDEFSLTLHATGDLDENQTRRAMYLVCNSSVLYIYYIL